MGNKTPFYEFHLTQRAKIVDFAGWDMPLHYGSQIEEHHKVRQSVGLFDVSHMGIIDLIGKDIEHYLRYILANNIDRIDTGQALYTCMLNENGGIIDDLIVYKMSITTCRLVINAGAYRKDMEWFHKTLKSFSVDMVERRDMAMLSIQGPDAADKIGDFLIDRQAERLKALPPFHFLLLGDRLIARTGYTGEDGFEMIFPKSEARLVWQGFVDYGLPPCGLAARDTLRLEAGLNLCGTDMNENVTPLESNLAWTVKMDPKDREFIGRKALEKQSQAGIKRKLVGLILEDRGIMRTHQKVLIEKDGEGEITSGGYSPTLGKSIALARVPIDIGPTCYVSIRNQAVQAKVVKPPFVKPGPRVITKLKNYY